MKPEDKRRVLASAAALLAIPFYFFCGTGQVRIGGEAMPPPQSWYFIGNEFGWLTLLVVALVFAVRSNIPLRKTFIVLTVLLLALRMLGEGIGIVPFAAATGLMAVSIEGLTGDRGKQGGSNKALQPDVLRRRRRTLIIVHGVLLVLLLLMFSFVIPRFKEMFESFGGPLPYPTELLISISDSVSHYFALMVLWIPFLLWLDARTYSRFCNRYGERAGRWWYLCVVTALVLLTVYCVWAMFLPVWWPASQRGGMYQ